MPKFIGLRFKHDFYWYERYHVDYRIGGHGDDPHGQRFSERSTFFKIWTLRDDETYRVMIPGYIMLCPRKDIYQDALVNTSYMITINGRDAFYTTWDILYAIARFDVSPETARKYLEKGDEMAGLAILATAAQTLEKQGVFGAGLLGYTRLGRSLGLTQRSTIRMETETHGRFADFLARMEREKPTDWWMSLTMFCLGLRVFDHDKEEGDDKGLLDKIVQPFKLGPYR